MVKAHAMFPSKLSSGSMYMYLNFWVQVLNIFVYSAEIAHKVAKQRSFQRCINSSLKTEGKILLGCPDVDPYTPQKLDIISAVSSLYLNILAS